MVFKYFKFTLNPEDWKACLPAPSPGVRFFSLCVCGCVRAWDLFLSLLLPSGLLKTWKIHFQGEFKIQRLLTVDSHFFVVTPGCSIWSIPASGLSKTEARAAGFLLSSFLGQQDRAACLGLASADLSRSPVVVPTCSGPNAWQRGSCLGPTPFSLWATRGPSGHRRPGGFLFCASGCRGQRWCSVTSEWMRSHESTGYNLWAKGVGFTHQSISSLRK